MFGIAFYRPGISRLGTSPVKVSEYLSCGLPVIINAGIGDTDRVIAQEDVGALVRDFNDDEYAKPPQLFLGLSITRNRRVHMPAKSVKDCLICGAPVLSDTRDCMNGCLVSE